MLQWFLRFPEFAEFSELLFHLGKTPLYQSCSRSSNAKNVNLLILLLHIDLIT